MDLQAAMQELVDKDRIRDVLHNYVHAVDRVDAVLLASVFHADAELDYGDFRGSPADFVPNCMAFMKRATPSQHSLSNIKISVAGNRASSVAYVRAMHGGKFRNAEKQTIDLVGYARYIDEWEKRGDEWRVIKRVVAYDWTQMPVRTVQWTEAHLGNLGKMDESDPVYKLNPPLYKK